DGGVGLLVVCLGPPCLGPPCVALLVTSAPPVSAWVGRWLRRLFCALEAIFQLVHHLAGPHRAPGVGALQFGRGEVVRVSEQTLQGRQIAQDLCPRRHHISRLGAAAQQRGLDRRARR